MKDNVLHSYIVHYRERGHFLKAGVRAHNPNEAVRNFLDEYGAERVVTSIEEAESQTELEDIKARITAGGWTLTSEASDIDMPKYQKAVGRNIMQISADFDERDVGVYGYLGVCDVEIAKFEREAPYDYGDLKRMKALIEITEEELLDKGIPFRPNYGFCGNRLESCLDKNFRLREKYHIRQYELEAGGEQE